MDIRQILYPKNFYELYEDLWREVKSTQNGLPQSKESIFTFNLLFY